MKNEIWIVDDERDLAQAYSDLLSTKYPTRVFHSAQETLDAFNQTPNAMGLLLSDIKMPNFDGVSLVRKLRELELSAPVIMLSGYAEKEMLIHASNLQLHGFLEKPCSPDTLHQLVENAFQRTLLNLQRKDLFYAYSSLYAIQKSLLENYIQRAVFAENVLYEANIDAHPSLDSKKNLLKFFREDRINWSTHDEIVSQINDLLIRIALIENKF